MTRARLGLPWWHPAVLIATGFGAGLLPWAPGTWGSLAALPCAWIVRSLGGVTALAVAATIAFATGCWAAGRVARATEEHDPGFIIIDEVAAQWLVLLIAPLDWRWFAAAFLLFRLFDIAKPWPARMIERSVGDGHGIMLDDVVAALYAVVPLLIGEGILGVRP